MVVVAETTTDYKFDGATLRDRNGNKVAVFDGKVIRDAAGKRLGSIEGDWLKGPSQNRLVTFDGSYVRDAAGSRLGTLKEIQQKIEGPGGMSLVSLWFLLIR